MSMRVAFYKVDDGRLCAWTALIPKRRPLPGTTMAAGRDLPHDLAQFVVESTLGLRSGSGAALDRRDLRERPAPSHEPGRQVISTHHAALVATERVVNAPRGRVARQGGDSGGSGLDDARPLAVAARRGGAPRGVGSRPRGRAARGGEGVERERHVLPPSR
jgi:hypothetical protein